MQVVDGAQLKAEFARIEFVFADLAILEFGDPGGVGQGDFIHAVATHHDHGVFAAHLFEHADHDADEVFVENADQLVLGFGWIGQWPEDVENRAHAHFLAHGRDMLHRAVVVGREHEADAQLVDAFTDLTRRDRQIHAQRFERIGAA